jgi:superoxide reductase
MEERRDFLKGSLIVAGAAVLGNAIQVQAATMFPNGLIYTKEAPGRWAGKEGAHVPVATVQGAMVTVKTPHPMTKEHYIVKHTLITPEGKLLGEKIFTNTDTAAESSYTLPEGFKGTLWATSFCNIHDLWLTEFTV